MMKNFYRITRGYEIESVRGSAGPDPVVAIGVKQESERRSIGFQARYLLRYR
jgi:hypothetical protein